MTTSDHVSPLLLTAPPTAEPFAWEWVDKIRRREVSATEVARHYLDRITSVNDVVNAVAWIDEDLVLGQAGAADEALRDGGGGDGPFGRSLAAERRDVTRAEPDCKVGRVYRSGLHPDDYLVGSRGRNLLFLDAEPQQSGRCDLRPKLK